MPKISKLGKKRNIALFSSGFFIILLTAILVYAFVITNVGYWVVSKFTPDSEEVKISYVSASNTGQMISDEGIVLLQNDDNFLPLSTSEVSKTKLNVFGMRSVQITFNGGGSAATDPTKATKLETALEGAKGNFEVNDDLLYLYYNYYNTGDISIDETDAPVNGGASEFVENVQIPHLPEVPVSAYTDSSLYDSNETVISSAKNFSDVAVIVIGRAGQERIDIPPKNLRLSDDEQDLVDLVTDNFENVVLIVNSVHTLELGFVDDYPEIKSVLWVGYPGETGTESIAKILNGTVNPSGHLPDTWVYDNTSHISVNNYVELNEDRTEFIPGSFIFDNAPTVTMSALFGGAEVPVGYSVNYAEGIFVGYRYFETRHDTDESFKYDEVVKYPFGYGMSYTSFEQNLMAINEEDGTITVRVSVKNSGEVAGKDVIQVYYNPPYTGEIEKSTVNLIAFKKTNEIAPGETEYYSLTFDLEEMASYDYKEHEAYILEAGSYEIMLRDNSHDHISSMSFSLKNEIIYNEDNDGKRTTDLITATNIFDDANRYTDYLTRDWDETTRAFTGPLDEDFEMTPEILAALTYVPKTDTELGFTAADLPDYGVEFDTTITFSDVKNLPKEDQMWDKFVSQLTLEELSELSGNGAFQINGINRLGVPRSLTPDGSMAIAASAYSGAIMGTDGKGITYPTPTILAATWSPELAALMGESVAIEGKAFGYSGWYAPSMNIHRTPFDGRNYEYYSEDPMLSGLMAANVIATATENGMIAFAKHFVMHDRQYNGREQIMNFTNEQALREIYLKPFEYAIKEGGVLGVMSAFDYLGLTWAGAHDGLLNTVLRDEWGFEGLVVTDANVYPHMNVHQMVLNGGDLSLDILAAWGFPGQGSLILDYAENPDYNISTINGLQYSAKNILYAVAQTWKADEE